MSLPPRKRSTRMVETGWLAVLLAAALLFTACGDDGAEPAATAGAAAEGPAAQTAEVSEPEPAEEPAAQTAEVSEPEPAEEPAAQTTEVSEPEPAEEPAAQTTPAPTVPPASTVPPEPIDIRLVTWGAGRLIDFIDLYVASENGYFAEAGVNLEQLPGADGADAVRQIVTGNADIAMADPLSGLFGAIAGADLEGFYCPYTQNWMTMLVNTGAGIESPRDLRGKTVAVASEASTSRSYAVMLLAGSGITEQDVTFVATGTAFGEALAGGEAQAASTWGSINWDLLEAGGIPDDQVGDYEIWQYEQVPGPSDVYFAMRGWLDRNEDGVARFIDAVEKAKLWIEENPEAAAEIGSRHAVDGGAMDRNLAVIGYRIRMQNNGPGVADNGMGYCDVATIQDVAEQAAEVGILPGASDASAVISNRFID